MHAPDFLTDLTLLLALGVAVVLLGDRVRLPPIVGFLITGVLCGPFGFGVIRDTAQVEALAELGVVLLLFTVGIEFSVRELSRMGSFLLVGGGLQVALTTAATAVLARAVGVAWPNGVFLGMLVALSSTAIVLRLLAGRGEMDSPHGRAALGILIFQDLCIVPMMLLAPFLRGEGRLEAIVPVALKAAAFHLAAWVAARFVVPRILHRVVKTRKREVFLLTVVLLCLGAALVSSLVGLSLALGAFIAGLTISESEYSHQALGEVLPLREVFNSLFFVSIGMLFDFRTALAQPLLVAGALAAVLLGKTAITAAVTWALGQPLRVAIVTALTLAQIGEFSFVLSRAGVEAGLLGSRLEQLFLAVAVLSLAATPLLSGLAPRLAGALDQALPGALVRGHRALTAAAAGDARLADHVIIVGYGVNGHNLARALRRVDVPFAVVEMNPDVVRRERRHGRAIIYGDATRQEVLEFAGVARARVLVVAISDAAATRAAVALARRLNPQLHIVVRSRYLQEVEPLSALGTDEVVPEEFETSIEIFSRVLHRYLVPSATIDEIGREIRRDAYEMFRAPIDADAAPGDVRRVLGDLSVEVVRAEPGSEAVGRSLGECELEARSGATVVAIQRGAHDQELRPTPASRIQEGDLVLLLGRPPQLAAAAALLDRAATPLARAANAPSPTTGAA